MLRKIITRKHFICMLWDKKKTWHYFYLKINSHRGPFLNIMLKYWGNSFVLLKYISRLLVIWVKQEAPFWLSSFDMYQKLIECKMCYWELVYAISVQFTPNIKCLCHAASHALKHFNRIYCISASLKHDGFQLNEVKVISLLLPLQTETKPKCVSHQQV